MRESDGARRRHLGGFRVVEAPSPDWGVGTDELTAVLDGYQQLAGQMFHDRLSSLTRNEEALLNDEWSPSENGAVAQASAREHFRKGELRQLRNLALLKHESRELAKLVEDQTTSSTVDQNETSRRRARALEAMGADDVDDARQRVFVMVRKDDKNRFGRSPVIYGVAAFDISGGEATLRHLAAHPLTQLKGDRRGSEADLRLALGPQADQVAPSDRTFRLRGVGTTLSMQSIFQLIREGGVRRVQADSINETTVAMGCRFSRLSDRYRLSVLGKLPPKRGGD